MRPWLMLIVRPHDILSRASVINEALSVGAIDVVQIRCGPGDVLPDATIPSLHSLSSQVQNRPLYILNAACSLNREGLESLDGIHYPERYIGSTETLQMNFTFGISVHSLESALKASSLGAGYLQVGTMFRTASHPDKTIVEGPELIKKIRAMIPTCPLIGVGGIDEHNCIDILHAGGTGVAVIRSILDAECPRSATLRIRNALDGFDGSSFNSS